MFSCFWCNYSWPWHSFCWRSCGGGGFDENVYQVGLKKYLPIFVDTFLLKGRLNQIIFLLLLRLLWVFVLTGTLTFVGSQTGVVCPHRRVLIHWISFIGGELGEAFFDSFGNLFNDIWRVVRFGMYVLDFVVWFLVGSVSPVIQIKSDILNQIKSDI